MDWKFLCLNIKDPLAGKIHDLATLEKHMPGRVAEIVHWFKVYKIPDGKPENKFAFNDQPLDGEASVEVLRELHTQYKDVLKASQLGLWFPSKKN